ncbi:hypothetical protein D3C72_1125140 [compost metagenome]
MICCRSLMHMIAILGLTSVLSQIGTVSAWAGPVQCSALLNKEINQPLVAATIDRMVDLKMDIDLTQVSGDASPLSQTKKLEFESKFQELVKYYEGQLTEVQVRELIARKIKARQDFNQEEQNQKNNEKLARKDQQEKIYALREYEQVGRVPISLGSDYIRRIQYDPLSDSLFYMSHQHLYKLALKDGVLQEIVGENILDFALMGNEVLVQDSWHKVYRLDLSTKFEVEVYPTEQLGYRALSPRGNTVAVKKDGALIFVDPKTGTLLNQRFSDWAPQKEKFSLFRKIFTNKPPPQNTSSIGKFQFITENHVLISGYENNVEKTIIFDLSKNKVFETSLAEKDFGRVSFNEETGMIVFIGGLNTMRVINIADLNNFAQEVKVISEREILKQVTDVETHLGSISFIDKETMIVTTYGTDPNRRRTLWMNVEDFSIRQLFRTEEAGTSTKGNVILDKTNKRILEMGAHRNEAHPSGYSDYFIDIWMQP